MIKRARGAYMGQNTLSPLPIGRKCQLYISQKISDIHAQFSIIFFFLLLENVSKLIIMLVSKVRTLNHMLKTPFVPLNSPTKQYT